MNHNEVTFTTQSCLPITIAPLGGQATMLCLVVDGEAYPLTRQDAERLAKALRDVAANLGSEQASRHTPTRGTLGRGVNKTT